MNKSADCLPSMLTGAELITRMTYLPEYDPDIIYADPDTRLVALNDLSTIYLPTEMSVEIYTKLYLSMIRSLSKKKSPKIVRQGLENRKWIIGKPHNSIMGGSDSYSIIGKAGIGKSTAIGKALEIAGGTEAICIDNPYQMIIPYINVQCPHDCSIKGLLLEILRAVDECIGTRYRERAIRNRASIDSLIGTVSQVAINHLLLLVVDECQNVVRTQRGIDLVSALIQLINSSGVSLCFVGLPELEEFFQRELHLARRTTGLSYTSLRCDEKFTDFCESFFRYQYVRYPVPLTNELIETLYQCSGGVIGTVLALVIEAQQVAILSGKEMITKDLLTETFQNRLHNLSCYAEPVKRRSQTAVLSKKRQVPDLKPISDSNDRTILTDLFTGHMDAVCGIVELLTANNVTVVELEI